MDRLKRIWYLSPMRAAKVQASLRIRAVLPEPSLLAHTSSKSRGTFRQKARSLAPLNGWACAVKVCHDRMLEDTNSLDGAHLFSFSDIYHIFAGSFALIGLDLAMNWNDGLLMNAGTSCYQTIRSIWKLFPQTFFIYLGFTARQDNFTDFEQSQS